VREEIGGTYSPWPVSDASETFPGYGYLVANVDVDPATAEKISDLVISLADDLATNGVTEDELERARQPLLTEMQQSLRTNSYWLNGVLACAQESPKSSTGRAHAFSRCESDYDRPNLGRSQKNILATPVPRARLSFRLSRKRGSR